MVAFRLGSRTVDLASGRVLGEDPPAELTPTEVRLLRYLALRSGELVAREELLVQVWGYVATVRSRTIDTTISRVRAKLEDDPASPRFLHTVYGRGVRLDHVEPVQTEVGATRFVGRRALLEALAATVRRTRLTTVWGPGGSGKSRLVAEVLPRLGTDAALVGCGGVRDARDLDLAVAEALGVGSGAALGRMLAREPLILVLDECESAVGPIADRVSGWLAGGRRLQVVATSRAELRVPGEQLFEVGPLEPEEATALFVDRARLRDPGFAVDRDEPGVERIVARVDRLPLAIEIAASQLHLLGLDGLESLLGSPLGVVGLGEVVERSFAGLSPEDRAVVAAASLFRAPFDLEDLAAVAGIPVERALRTLDSVVRRSLGSARGGRHRLYALVRDHAARSLGADHPAHERHARWFGRLGTPEAIERARTDLAARAVTWRAAPDLRAAVAAAVDPELASRCGLALLWCCARQGRVAEGSALAERLSALPCTPRSRVVLAILTAALSAATGDDRAAVAALERAVPLLSTPEEHVGVRCASATSRARLGDLDGARRELEAAAPFAPRATNRALYLGTAAFHAEPPEDEARMREALGVARAQGDRVAEMECLGMLAATAHVRYADWDEGWRSFRRLLDLCGAHDAWVRPRVRAFVGLAQLERAQGDLEAAESGLEQAVTLAERHGLEDVAQLARVELARVWNQAGRHEDALGLVEPLAAVERPPPHKPTARALLALAEVRERLGELDPARRLLGRVLQHRTDGRSAADFAADALDLVALLDGDEAALAAAEALDQRRVARARRRVFAAILASRAGRTEQAEVARAAAREDIARLGLLPESDAVLWLARAHLVAERTTRR